MSHTEGPKGSDGGTPRHALRVIRVEPGEHLTMRTVSEEYKGLLTHWVRGRSILCEGEQCPTVQHRSGCYWKGYALVQQWFQPRTCWYTAVLEISEHCELDFRDRWKRGQLWSIKRDPQTGRHKSPICARLESQVHFGGLPLQFDFTPILRTLYHVATINGWCKNPMPSRILVEPSYGDAPFPEAPQVDKEAAHAAWLELRRRFKLAGSEGRENQFLEQHAAEHAARMKQPHSNGIPNKGGDS